MMMACMYCVAGAQGADFAALLLEAEAYNKQHGAGKHDLQTCRLREFKNEQLENLKSTHASSIRASFPPPSNSQPHSCCFV
jgi:hypothetical protein